ncbi:MAG: S-layer homology domain-containing protein, partial [Nitriliruptoraceae bacterium]
MRASLRLKRTLVVATTGALVLGLMPGAAFADAVDFSEVCEGAEAGAFEDGGDTHGDAIDCMNSYTDANGDPIFRGTALGDAAPFENVTRGQFAALVVRFATVADPDIAEDYEEPDEPSFSDTEGTTFEEEIEIISFLGLIDGFEDGTFGPNEDVTRGQAAKILFEAHTALGVEFEDTYPEAFEDEGETYGEFIRALSAVGIVVGTTDTTFEPFAFVQRGATATLLARSAQVLLDADIWTESLVEPVQNAAFLDGPELIGVEIVNQTSTQTLVEFIFDAEVELDAWTDTVNTLQRV